MICNILWKNILYFMPGHLPAHAPLFERHGRPVKSALYFKYVTMKAKGGKVRQIDAKTITGLLIDIPANA